MEFYCIDKTCPSRGSGPYVMRLPAELCVDEQNRAAIFCPHCRSVLVPRESDQRPARIN